MSIVWNTHLATTDCRVDLASTHIPCDIGLGTTAHTTLEVHGGLGRSGYPFI